KMTAAAHTVGGFVVEQIAYTYDVLGRLVQRASTVTGVERFVYDGLNPIADLDGDNHVFGRRLFGTGVDQPLARLEAQGGWTWYLKAYQHSVIGLTNSMGGLLGVVAYDGFGNTIQDTTGLAHDRFGYTAREKDSATGLQYNRARWYDAATGRWMSEDPKG